MILFFSGVSATDIFTTMFRTDLSIHATSNGICIRAYEFPIPSPAYSKFLVIFALNIARNHTFINLIASYSCFFKINRPDPNAIGSTRIIFGRLKIRKRA